MKKLFLLLLMFCSITIFGQGYSKPTSVEFDNLHVKGNLQVDGIFNNIPDHIYTSFQDSAVTLAITTNEWITVGNTDSTLFILQESVGFTIYGDGMIVGETGDYRLWFYGAFDVKDKKLYESRFIQNSTGLTHFHSQGPKDNGLMPVVIFYYGAFTEGDTLQVQIRCTNSDDDIDVKDGSIFMEFFHN